MTTRPINRPRSASIRKAIPLRERFRDTLAITTDPTRLPEFAAALKPHHCTISHHPVLNGRYSYWRVLRTGTKTSDPLALTTGFDVDIERIIRRLDEGLALDQIEVHNGGKLGAPPAAIASKARDQSFSCRICGEPGGLPCPKLLGRAKLMRIKVKDLPGDHVHPGRCRKRLKALLEAAGVQQRP